jgi:hypothetical protein
MGREYSEKLINNNEMLDKIINYTDFEYMKTIPLKCLNRYYREFFVISIYNLK